jgi:hypothetical protein
MHSPGLSSRGRFSIHLRESHLDVWFYPMKFGESLPTLPIWLDHELCIPLPLDTSYEETCRLLHIA